MRITLKLLAILVVGSLAASAQAKSLFNPAQLEQFEKTNQCSGCDLSYARFSDGNHSGAVLNDANLSNTAIKGSPGSMNFSAANLRNANLSGSYLDFSNFSNADLTGAHFDGADISYANFSGAIGADLKNAINTCSVILPNGKTTKSCSDK